MLVLTLVTCTEPPEDERLVVNNDLANLGTRVSYVNEPVVLDTSIQSQGLLKTAIDPVRLVLIAELTHRRSMGSPCRRPISISNQTKRTFLII